MKKKKIIIILIAVLAALVAGVFIFMYASTYRNIKVIEINGDVTVENPDTGSVEAYVNMLLHSKDTVLTEADSQLYLLLDSDKCVEIEPMSVVHIEAAGNSKFNTTRTKLVLDEGSVVNEINSKLSLFESYTVETPSTCMAVRGTIFTAQARVNADGEKETYIEVKEGTVEAYREDEKGKVEIPAGFHATIKESDSLSDINAEYNYAYIEFPFDINEITLEGQRIEDISMAELVSRHGVTNPPTEKYGIPVGDAHSSSDGKYTHQSIGDGEIFSIGGEISESTVLVQDSSCITLERELGAEHDYLDEYITPIIPGNATKEQIFDMMHIEELEALCGEGDSCGIKCNWSNEVCNFHHESFNDGSGDYMLVIGCPDRSFGLHMTDGGTRVVGWQIEYFGKH